MDYRDGQLAGGRPDLSSEQIGPYSLIAEIASGDFTTVHLAHKPGAHGFDRLVAIKRLKPAFAKQAEWSQLLLDEARLGACVDHPNTVDILDVGTDAGVYVVMEYVEGADLEQLLARSGRERHPRYIVPAVVDALSGLHAIHTQRDELGESLAMVHQAPRARHILVGIHGNARIADYSQVTARGLIPSTLRGKGLSPAYMAPEQVLISEPVSARTDVFILGITLWEALTGERLFKGETPSLVRRAITERDIPKPSEVGLTPPRCFDGICMRALQRNPDSRYQTAEEFARDLREVAQEEALLASASELGQWVRALASRSLIERRRALGADEPSQEIAVDVLEKRVAAQREQPSVAAKQELVTPRAEPARPQQSLVTPPHAAGPAARAEVAPSVGALGVDDLEHDRIGRSITVPVMSARPLHTPAAREPKRAPTGTLLGVTAKPRSVGLPPPAAAAAFANNKRAPGAPQYRGSLGSTAHQGTPQVDPAIARRPSSELSANTTLPEGSALTELERPINLPTSSSEAHFVGFHGAPEVDIVMPPRASAPAAHDGAVSFGRGAAFGGAASPTTPGRRNPALGNTVAHAGAPMPAMGATPSAAAASFPYMPGTSQTAAREDESRRYKRDEEARRIEREEELRRYEPPRRHSEPPPRRSEPPARNSRVPMHHTLDGNVPQDVFERLRPANGMESWRPPAQAVHYGWQDEGEPQPRGLRGGTVLLAAALLVAGFFGYRSLVPSEARSAPVTQAPAQPAPAAHAMGAAPVQPVAPVAPSHGAPQVPAQAPAAQPQTAQPQAPVPPVAGLQDLSRAPADTRAAAPRPAPRTQMRREEPVYRASPRPASAKLPAVRAPTPLPENPY